MLALKAKCCVGCYYSDKSSNTLAFINLNLYFNMKKYLIILLVFAAVFQRRTSAQTFDYVAEYTYTYPTDSTDVSTVYTDLMVLLINPERTWFSSQAVLYLDTIGLEEMGIGKAIAVSRTAPKSKTRYQIDRRVGGTSYFRERISNTNYQNTYEDNQIDWKLGNDRKTIGGYSVRNATAVFAGKTFEAWYAEDIPLNAGPYKFANLPGLIFEVYDTRKLHHFVLVNLKQTPLEFSPTVTKGIEVPMKKINKARQNSGIAEMQARGITITIQGDEDGAQMQKILDREAEEKANNTIECP